MFKMLDAQYLSSINLTGFIRYFLIMIYKEISKSSFHGCFLKICKCLQSNFADTSVLKENALSLFYELNIF